jgi:hypothetical protein
VTAHWGAMQLSADWLITTGHLTLLALSVLFCSSEDELPESGVNQGILTVRGYASKVPTRDIAVMSEICLSDRVDWLLHRQSQRVIAIGV